MDDLQNFIADLQSFLNQEAAKLQSQQNSSAPVAPPQIRIDVADSSVTIGEPLSIMATVSSVTALTGVIIDIEVYDTNGNKIDQAFEVGQSIESTTPLTYTVSWTSQTSGTFTISAGIFDDPQSGSTLWGTKHVFLDNLATVTVNKPVPYVPPVSSSPFYVYPYLQVDQYAAANPVLQAIADVPQGIWFGQWNDLPNSTSLDKASIAGINADAATVNKEIIGVVYNIPNRDNGGYSAGGAQDAATYQQWITDLASVWTQPSICILEPDSVSELSTTPGRAALLQFAVKTLNKHKVFLDGGGVNWNSAQVQAENLMQCGIQEAAGFSLNVSGFSLTAAVESYGDEIIAILEQNGITGKQYVIDTSRNGNGVGNRSTFNPTGVKLGDPSTLTTNNKNCYAYLWVKDPGESDGNNSTNAPAAGNFWPEYADCLVTGDWSKFQS